MARRLALLIVGLLLLIPVAGAHAATGSTSQPFFGTTVSAGDSIASLDMGNSLTMKNVSVSSVAITGNGSTISATGSLYIGTDTSPLSVSLSYTNTTTTSRAVGITRTTTTGNWTIAIAANSAGSRYAPHSGSTVNLNNLSGQLSGSTADGVVSRGSLTASLAIEGISYGGATYSGTATVSSTGLQATVSVGDVTLATGYTIQNAAVTLSSTSSAVSMSGALVANTTTVNVSVSYTDTSNWSLSIAANSAGPGYSAPSTTSLDVNDISGTITDVKGNISSALMASGVALGDGTFDMVVSFNADGTFTANAAGESLTIGGMLLNSAAITMSTASDVADITADFTTEAGTFSFDIGATGISGGGYSLHIAGSAADLAVSSTSSKFAMQSFGFDTTVDVPATGCISWDAAVNGSLLMRGDTYTLNNAEIAFSCNTLTKFVFSISVTHETSDVKQMTVTLTINWFSTQGSYTPTFGTNSHYTSKAPYSGTTTKYYSGFFGTADFSYLYAFEKGSFNKHITFGLGFSIAVYQQLVKTVTASSVTDPTTSGCTALTPCYSAGAWDVAIGAMGYFDADERISGDILCNLNVAPSNDFVCRGSMYVNPSNAGSYHEPMHNI